MSTASSPRNFRREHTERYTHGLLMEALRERLTHGEIAALTREGGAMTEAQAVHIATRSTRTAAAAQ